MFRSWCTGAVAFCSLLPSATAQLLGPPTTVNLGSSDGIELVGLADTNGDGNLDVVVAEVGGSALCLLGDGHGGLGAPIASPTQVGLVADVYMLDVGGDGHVDLLINGVGGGRICIGTGTGRFALPVAAPVSSRRAVDWNGDGHVDLVVSNSPGLLQIAYGTGNGMFAAPTSIPLPTGQGLPFGTTSILAGDLDGDGHRDLIMGGLFGATTFVFGDGIGNVVGSYAAPQALAGQIITPQLLVDLDHDGDLDLLARNAFGTLHIARNEGNGLFTSASPVVGGDAGSLAAIDIDADGDVDLVTSSSPYVLVLRGDGMSGFAPPESFFAGPHERVTTGDLDRDGRPDVVAAGAGHVHVLRNQLPSTTGLAAYGTGTPTCSGTMGMWGPTAPTIGAIDFRVQCSNVPPNGLGLLAMGTRVTNGWAPFGLGLTLHLGLAFPVASMRSDAGGVGSARLPIPAVPWLAGLTVHVQSFWVGDASLGNTCSPVPGELASSRGLSITLQP